MTRRVMTVLAGAALAGSLLAGDAEARGGGGHGGGGHGGGIGHMIGFVGARTVDSAERGWAVLAEDL
jgi:hypothetical protein